MASYCKRCGHNRDCHKFDVSRTLETGGHCGGFTKRKGQCKCPGMVYPVASVVRERRGRGRYV